MSVPRPPSYPDLLPALSALPLFPLPMVHFPDAVVPLHVFEPRYCAMIRDCLEGHRALAVVLVQGRGPVDAHGHPPIASVATAGVIVDHTELPGGRFNILVRGRARVGLAELPFGGGLPYRRARAAILPEQDEELPPSSLGALLSAATGFAAALQAREPSFKVKFPKGATPSRLVHVCASELLLDTKDQQAALEAPGLEERVRLVTEALALQRLALAGGGGQAN